MGETELCGYFNLVKRILESGREWGEDVSRDLFVYVWSLLRVVLIEGTEVR